MRESKALLLSRTLLLTFLSLGVSGNPVVGSQDERTRLAQVFEIQTQKNVQPPEALRRSDCIPGEECEDYSGLPTFDSGKSTIKNSPGKDTVKNLKKPFIGFSITRPIQ